MRRRLRAILLEAPFQGADRILGQGHCSLIEVDKYLAEVPSHRGSRVREPSANERIHRSARGCRHVPNDVVAHVAAANGDTKEFCPRARMFLVYPDEDIRGRPLLSKPRRCVRKLEAELVTRHCVSPPFKRRWRSVHTASLGSTGSIWDREVGSSRSLANPDPCRARSIVDDPGT